MRLLLTSSVSFGLALAPIISVQAQSLPQNAHVIAGAATVTSANSQSLLIDQSSTYAIIEWDGFSIDTGNQTHFNNGAGYTLNRVTGNDISAIDGNLTASGSLYLINQNGIIIGKHGIVQTGGSFVASTLDIYNDDFLNGGDDTFKGNSNAAIVNLGSIKSLNGDIGILAQKIYNQGQLSAANGTVGLAAGREILLRNVALDDGKFMIKIGDADSLIEEQGMIAAANVELRSNGGNIYAMAGNQNGSIKATGVSKQGGRIFLTAGGGKITTSKKISAKRKTSNGKTSGGDIFINAKLVEIANLLDASGSDGNGGTIDIGGQDRIALANAQLNASGQLAGKIRVGGEYQGGKNLAQDEVENVDILTIDQFSSLKADTLGANGDGGTVIAWADGSTVFNGSISAQAGNQSGNGGLVETSGKQRLGVGDTASVNTLAANGTNGIWLLDPQNVIILPNVGAATLAQVANGADTTSNLTISALTINAAAATVNIIASQTIAVDGAINMTNANVGLVMTAGTNIFLNQNISNLGDQTYNGNIVLGADSDLFSDDGNITINGTVNGLFNFGVLTDGAKIFNGAIGDQNALLTLYVDFSSGPPFIASSTQLNGGSVNTIGDQFYGDAITVNGATVLTASHTDAYIDILAGLSTTDANSDLTVMAGSDINIGGDIQYNGTGNINIIAGWDGTTAFNANLFDGQDLATTSVFGLSSGSGITDDGIVYIGDNFQSNSVSVGSKDGNTRIYGHDIAVYGSIVTSTAFAQIGYLANGQSTSGNIYVMAVDDVEVYAGEQTLNYAQIGHGGYNITSITAAGDISVKAGENIIIEGWIGEVNYAQIGHGGHDSQGEYSGDISLTAKNDIGVYGGQSFNGFAQVGHGGINSRGDYKGNIKLTADYIDVLAGSPRSSGSYAMVGHGGTEANGDKTGNIEITSTNYTGVGGTDGELTYAQIGHGGAASEGTLNGDIKVTTSPLAQLYVEAGSGLGAYAQIGHGGVNANSNATGNIDISSGFIGVGRGSADAAYGQIGHGGGYSIGFTALSQTPGQSADVNLMGDINVSGSLIELFAGTNANAYAQIGHGDVTNIIGGNRMGNIDLTSTSEISVADDAAKAWIGHRTNSSNAISSANMSVTAGTLDQVITTPLSADLSSGGNSLFSSEIIDYAMQGGDVKIFATDSSLSLNSASSYSSGFELTLRASHDVVLNNGETITNAGNGDIILAAGRDFHNNSGSASALTTGGRHLVYSTDWDITTRGGMTGGNLYNRSYTSYPPSAVTQSGDQFIYTRQPIITITGIDTSVDYNGNLQTQTGYTTSGLVNGDSLADAMTNAALLSGYINGGTYTTGLVSHDGLSGIGYGFNVLQGNLTIVNNTTPPNDGYEKFELKPALPIDCLKDIYLCEDINTDPIQLSKYRAQ